MSEDRAVAIERAADRFKGYAARYNAPPVPPQVIECAERLLRSMPAHWPVPQVAANDDGEVSFAWYLKAGRVVVLFDPGCVLVWIGNVGPKRLPGVEMPFPEEWPLGLVADINDIVPQEDRS